MNLFDILSPIAQASGLDPQMLHTFAKIESGGNPRAQKGSYLGLFQLSQPEFNKYGGGNIFDPTDNARAGAAKLKSEMAQFKSQFGRDPTGQELYMIHQQGWGGAQSHWSNPDRPAWKSMASTAEGRQRGDDWAREAVWGNVPDDVKARYGGVDNITSKQFTDMWGDKYNRLSGSQPQQVAKAPQDSTPSILKSGYGRESGPGIKSAVPELQQVATGGNKGIHALQALFQDAADGDKDAQQNQNEADSARAKAEAAGRPDSIAKAPVGVQAPSLGQIAAMVRKFASAGSLGSDQGGELGTFKMRQS